MSDLINRKSALKALRPIMRKSDYFYEMLKAIQDIPSAQPEQRWIPCSERLPIGSDIVLLSLPPSINMNGDELVGGVICGHYIGEKNEIWGISDGSTFGYGLVSVKYGTNPTHWMPLPEPYKDGVIYGLKYSIRCNGVNNIKD